MLGSKHETRLGLWGMPAEQLRTLPGHDPDVAKNREQGQRIMRGLGLRTSGPCPQTIPPSFRSDSRWQPHVEDVSVMVNSGFSGHRREDI